MHYVVSGDSGVTSFDELAGKSFIIGKGSFGASEAAKNFKLFGLDGKVKLVDAELNAAVPALKNRQVDGFATAGSYPAPNVIEAAAGTEVQLLSMTDEQIKATKRTKLVIPAGTYPGIDKDVNTTSLPVVAYTTTKMSDDDAYTLTKSYWEAKGSMGSSAKWWDPRLPLPDTRPRLRRCFPPLMTGPCHSVAWRRSSPCLPSGPSRSMSR